MIRTRSGSSPEPGPFPGAIPYSPRMSALPAALGLFGLVLLAGLAIVLFALFAISLRRAARRKAERGHEPTALTDAWAEAGRRSRDRDTA